MTKLDVIKLEPIPAFRHVAEYLPLHMIARVKKAFASRKGEEDYVIYTTDNKAILITKEEFETWFNSMEA